MSDQVTTVYVPLLDEGVDGVSRPVAADSVGPMIYRLLGTVPDGEKWAFQPGDLVCCEERWLNEGGWQIVAVAAFGLQ